MSSDSHKKNFPVQPSGSEQHARQVVEAEVVEEDSRGYTQDAGYNYEQKRAMSFGVHGRGWRQGVPFGQNPTQLSCLPAVITLILTTSIGLKFGFFASLGFLFFYFLGSSLALGISIRRTLRGKVVFAWLNRALVWVCAYALTIWIVNK